VPPLAAVLSAVLTSLCREGGHALILPNRTIIIYAGMRTGSSLLVDEYRMLLKPLRSSCIFTTGRFARRCLANSCNGVERILVMPTNHFKINAIWGFVTVSIRVNIIPVWNYIDMTGGSQPAD
jgi:cellobiose-specific phosphotransferase system component IIB